MKDIPLLCHIKVMSPNKTDGCSKQNQDVDMAEPRGTARPQHCVPSLSICSPFYRPKMRVNFHAKYKSKLLIHWLCNPFEIAHARVM